ncbi:PQQ-like beta-propeller repeat protein [Streptomyces sp. LP05-1]|uniref:PQQ-like beta-propeller repeat protein n=1 Tax=Streptomyces pyxinae TaxID=2970734 RepID=A0ABT2CK86_9ACTN|nr:PQQ-like beta-propeller repeat protein [Streptomyces sp. LP05-1]MCS0637827.1 PQQ-like beta-propeller repeat protein [Streptomyces sp. LP05-1]
MTQPPPPPNQPPHQPPAQPPPPPPAQPPAPPAQPPQGGFGAPQDPPPGGFGAPTAPPEDPGPGYGYPQAPPPPGGAGYGYPHPAAPGPQAPYGQPGQQPPYGQPGQNTYGQQPYGGPAPQQPYGGQPPGHGPGGYGYGHPTAPVPAAGPQGSGGKKLSTQMQIVIAAAVAVVLIVGAGVWYADSGDSGNRAEATGSAGTTGGADGSTGGGGSAKDGPGQEKAPDDTAAKIGVQLPPPPITDLTGVMGSWLTEKAYVKPSVDSVVAYDRDKGTPLWTLTLPGQVCAASRHVRDGRTAIAFEATKRVPPKNYQPCTEVGAIDLATGKLLWSKSVSGGTGGDEKVRFDEVTVGASTVAAGGTKGGAAWDLATGKEHWRPQVNAESCYDMGYGGGEALVAARKCGPYGSQYVVVQNLDPVSGAPLSSYKMPAGVEYAGVVSTKPLVVAADVGDTAGDGSSISDFFSIDEKTGKLKAKIAADADRYDAECGSTEVEECNRVVVGNGRLYLPTERHEGGGEYGDTNEIVSFDLTTGKPTTDKAEAGDRYSMFPLRMDGGNVIAYKMAPYDKGGQVVSIDGGTFKQTLLMENASDEASRNAERSFSLEDAEIRYGDGRLFISKSLLSRPSPVADSSRKVYMALGYTTH